MKTTHNNTYPLTMLSDGQRGIVVAVHGGIGFKGRMSALGFTPGARVRIVRNPSRGPLIVSVLDTQIALGRGQAAKVYVRIASPRRGSRRGGA